MSRAAQWRWERNRKAEDEAEAQMIKEAEESKIGYEDCEANPNAVPMKCNVQWNLNPLLYAKLMKSEYFKRLYGLKTYHEVVDEIYNKVDHAEPWGIGNQRHPSTCFSLMVKMFTLKMTKKQMSGLLNHGDSPYIRVVGFLYLRFVLPPEQLWDWHALQLHARCSLLAQGTSAVHTSAHCAPPSQS